MTNELRVWRIDDGAEVHRVIAGSKEEAIAEARELDMCEDEDDFTVSEVPGDQLLTVREDDGTKETMTCAQWVEKNGQGFLCSTCF